MEICPFIIHVNLGGFLKISLGEKLSKEPSEGKFSTYTPLFLEEVFFE